MNLDKIINIEDMRRLSRRKLPKIIFDYIEGGVDDELALEANLKSFSAHKLWPRYYADIPPVQTGVTLFGQDYAHPVGIGATGLAGLFRPNADLILAREARKWKIPFVVSTFSNDSLEKVAAEAGEYCWFQLYAARDRNVTAAMIGRARDAGIKCLEVTVDTPGDGKRERNRRNGFTRPLRLKPSVFLDAMTRPGWIYRYLKAGGIPMFETWQAYAPAGANVEEVTAYTQTQTPNRQTWKDFETMRRLWPGTLIAKGVMHPGGCQNCCRPGCRRRSCVQSRRARARSCSDLTRRSATDPRRYRFANDAVVRQRHSARL